MLNNYRNVESQRPYMFVSVKNRTELRLVSAVNLHQQLQYQTRSNELKLFSPFRVDQISSFEFSF